LELDVSYWQIHISVASRPGKASDTHCVGDYLDQTAQKVEAVCFCETLVSFYVTTRCHKPEVQNMNNNRRENLRTHNFEAYLQNMANQHM
jgi:hypothetical protein